MDRKTFIESHLRHIKEEEMRNLLNRAAQIEDFKTYCQSFDIELYDSHFKYIQKIGIVVEYEDIIYKLNKDLEPDKEGLIDVAGLKKHFTFNGHTPGYLYTKNTMGLVHPFFRRGLHKNSNYAPNFIDMFWLLDHDEKEKYIALDSNRLRINMESTNFFEEDTWYGAKFQKDISQIPDGNTKLVPPPELDPLQIDMMFGNTFSLDINWNTKDRIRSFQSKEFKTDEILVNFNGIEYHPVKYVHAEYDMDTGTFRHFDGAIHLYTDLEYNERKGSDFNHNNKGQIQIKPLSKKLFKLNGKILVKDWVQLTSHFMTGNPLIFEYFEGKLPGPIENIVTALRKSM